MLNITKKLFFFSLVFSGLANAQESHLDKLGFEADFRGRIEQDWQTRLPDGSYKDDRSRLRYRLRFGANYLYNQQFSFGFRMRTGAINKQQDPHITLGSQEEFESLPVSLEKLFMSYQKNKFSMWFGKNSFPFYKQNELFWIDNIYPDGLACRYRFPVRSSFSKEISLRVGHFIMNSSGTNFTEDSSFSGLQLVSSSKNQSFILALAVYHFQQIPLLPDTENSELVDHSFFHISNQILLSKTKPLAFESDFYHNFGKADKAYVWDYSSQKQALILSTRYGQLKQKGDQMFRISYAYIEKLGVIDYLAQNDWNRWDYSAIGSPDGRLSNFHGLELMAGLALDRKINLKMRYFLTEQLERFEQAYSETSQRIRLDINISL